jgi:hypothetical protein
MNGSVTPQQLNSPNLQFTPDEAKQLQDTYNRPNETEDKKSQ